jgi:hypothetical protein
MALPRGARAFDPDWAAVIPRGARVGLCYDADQDGDAGAVKAASLIIGRTFRVRPPIERGDSLKEPRGVTIPIAPKRLLRRGTRS